MLPVQLISTLLTRPLQRGNQLYSPHVEIPHLVLIKTR